MPGYDERKRKRQNIAHWGDDHELWRMDVRGLDMGLVSDKIERAVREAVTKHLLIDLKGKRLAVVLPSLMPHTLLGVVLSTLFMTFQNSRITLLSSPFLSIVVAGLRSGLVVDIGWRETTVTGIYEHREVHQKRTTRAMKMVTLEMAKLLERQDTEQKRNAKNSADVAEEELDNEILAVDLEQAEEVTTRVAWCRSRSRFDSALPAFQDLSGQLSSIAEAEVEGQAEDPASSRVYEEENTPISIPSPSSP